MKRRRRRFNPRAERFILLLVLAFALATISPVYAEQAERVYVIQRNERADGVHVVAGFEGFSQQPSIEVQQGRLGVVSIAGQAQWHGTVAARLNWCDSRLLIGGRVVVEQQCTRFPFAAKGAR